MEASMPGVLIETGYSTNKQDAANLTSPKFRTALAEGIAEGIMAYANRLQTVAKR
jgi:N-acetylmuramoyl-L-alanine amidase